MRQMPEGLRLNPDDSITFSLDSAQYGYAEVMVNLGNATVRIGCTTFILDELRNEPEKVVRDHLGDENEGCGCSQCLENQRLTKISHEKIVEQIGWLVELVDNIYAFTGIEKPAPVVEEPEPEEVNVDPFAVFHDEIEI